MVKLVISINNRGELKECRDIQFANHNNIKGVDRMSLTIEKVNEYVHEQGYPAERDVQWLLENKRRNQVEETVENNYDMCDFERWQHLKDVLFGESDLQIDWETASKIVNLLWEKDIEVLELK
jgi:hypothetical protein